MNVLPHSLEAHIIYIALQRCQTPPTRRLERWPSKRLCTGDRIRTCNYVYRVYMKRASLLDFHVFSVLPQTYALISLRRLHPRTSFLRNLSILVNTGINKYLMRYYANAIS